MGTAFALKPPTTPGGVWICTRSRAATALIQRVWQSAAAKFCMARPMGQSRKLLALAYQPFGTTLQPTEQNPSNQAQFRIRTRAICRHSGFLGAMIAASSSPLLALRPAGGKE